MYYVSMVLYVDYVFLCLVVYQRFVGLAQRGEVEVDVHVGFGGFKGVQ